MAKYSFMHIAALGLLSMSTGAEALLAGGGGGEPERPAEQDPDVNDLAVASVIELEADEATEAAAIEAARIEAANAKVAEILALPIGKMKGLLSKLDLFTLRAALYAEEAGEKRVGAVKSIEYAIDRNPEQIAAVAAAHAALAPTEQRSSGPLELPDHEPKLTNIEVLELLPLGARLAVIFGRQAFAYPELAPAEIAALERSSDGRALIAEDIHLSGVGLEAALAIEQAWLVANIDGMVSIVRRCEIPSNVTLEPGMTFKFPARSLIF